VDKERASDEHVRVGVVSPQQLEVKFFSSGDHFCCDMLHFLLTVT
jgi:hypothetical protein